MAYEVKSGDTIYDAAFNICGSLAGVDQLIELNTPQDAPYLDIKSMAGRDEPPIANRMESYTPVLLVGEILNTERVEVQNLEAVNARDFNSSVIDQDAVTAEINELKAVLRDTSARDFNDDFNNDFAI